MKNHTKNPIVIAIDIDDFLTTMETSELHKKEWLDPVHHSEKHFVMAEFTHHDRDHKVENLLTPGCIEFFQFLFDYDFIRPAFFSSGIRARNIDLAKKIVQTAIDAGGDSSWMDRYDVYSREDCFDTERLKYDIDEEIRRKFQPEHFFGNYKKDLRMIYYGREKYHELCEKAFEDPSVLLPDHEKDEPILRNLVMVEEDSSYLFPGQEKNMLLCPTYFHPYTYLINHQGEDTPHDPDDWRDKFKGANTIFYAAGVLNHAIERHCREKLPITEILWQEQGTLWVGRKRYQEWFPIHFFTKGRDVLRKYNPKLNFAVASSEPGASLK
ncbi:hypothetical protein MTBBW1_450014 [Desulfamplus magnetovallimortis]|uniref:Uncharacterized protein n=1 Tax=Desulfamplus magnetovallimortis TaxID=1246637 RepID=A0A1W1HHD6_9BACT|nr:hypothetical protein [Desulfamplus magnetovallimortis]SLM31843.1 hypothetical protein MTBBW1_450014 [Desulfamplus magnetovallimortis]